MALLTHISSIHFFLLQDQEKNILSELRWELEKELQLPAAKDLSYEDIYLLLLRQVSFLLENDFQQLILWLYRIDVSEKKLRALLVDQPQMDAAQLITGLMLERIALKIKTRQAYGSQDANPSDPERW